MRGILSRLGFMMAGNGPVVKIAVPSWRPDVQGKADIVEEIVRIVGVDKVPMTPFERGEAPRKPVLTPIQLRTRRAKRALAARGMIEAVTWSFIAKQAAELFGGGKQRAGARQSDRRRSLRHAAEPAAGPDRLRAGQCRSRLRRCRAVRGRPDLQGRPPGGSVHRRRRRPPRLRVVEGHRPALVRLGRGRRVRRQGRCARGAGRRRRADAGAADRAGRRRLAASGTLRHHPDRAAERPRLFRRAASARAGSACAPTVRWSPSR